jgi:branched-chain amino acid transport system substrate-binding protein
MRSNSKNSHGWLRLLGVALVALLVMAACGSDDGGDDATADTGGSDTSAPADEGSGEPVKVGVLLPYTGTFGIYGAQMETALRTRLAQDDAKAASHQIELVFEDDATDAGTAVTKATKMIEQDGVKIVICCAGSASTLAVAPILAEAGIPQVAPIPGASDLQKFATASSAAPTAAADAEKLGTYAFEGLKYKTASLIISDYSYGREVGDAFTKGFTDAGGKVLESLYTPLGTQDFGSLLSSVPDADVLLGAFAGADALRFVKQYDEFGVKDRMPLIGHGPIITELVLQEEGDAAIDVSAGFYYSSGIDLPENTRFMEALGKADPKLHPSHATSAAWAVGSLLMDVIDRLNGDLDDGEAVATAIHETEIDVPWGTLKFDPKTHFAVAPTYFYTVVRDGDVLKHEIKATIE